MAEYRYFDGTLRQGYYCLNCGLTVNMYGSGHNTLDYRVLTDEWLCEANPKLVEKLERANPLSGRPHFTIYPTLVKKED